MYLDGEPGGQRFSDAHGGLRGQKANIGEYMNESGSLKNRSLSSQQLDQLRRSSIMNLETNFHLARKAIETHFEFSAAKPELARVAIITVAKEHSRIYMDYL